MPQKNAQDRLWKILTPVLLVLAVLAMAKTLFVGLEIDEEYAFSLGFRLVKGDRLFYTMWEPHQLSALPAALVLALYTAIAGTTTGALLFARAVVLVCKAAMSAVFYRDSLSKNTPPKAFATAKAFGIIEENHLGRPPHGKARRRRPPQSNGY